MTKRLLTDDDFKKIRLLKLKNATKHVDRKRFRDSDESEDSKFERESSEEYDSEEEDEDEVDEEMGEDEISASMSSEEA